VLNLIWFHRLLIACAVLFCASFAAFEFSRYRADGGAAKLVLALIFAVLAVALFWYVRNLRRFLKLPEERKRP
jgi:ABC-type maltose transport system permease subunit